MLGIVQIKEESNFNAEWYTLEGISDIQID